MKVLVVYWHPEPQSFNHAMFQTICETLDSEVHVVRTSDLYAMRFDPISSRKNFTTVKDAAYFKPQVEELYASERKGFADDVSQEIDKLKWCDLMIWQFPLWWFGVPAAIKGWVDRVFAMGSLYGGGKVYATGVLKGKKALLSLTTGGPETTYLKDGNNGDLMGILRPVHRGILQFVGFDVLAPQVVYSPVRLTQEERKRELQKLVSRLKTVANEKPIEVGQY